MFGLTKDYVRKDGDYNEEGGWHTLDPLRTGEGHTLEHALANGEIRLAISWHDQGFGERKGEIRMELIRDGEVVRTETLFGEHAPHPESEYYEKID